MQPQIRKPSRTSVDKRLSAELLRKTPELTHGRGAHVQINVVCLDSALREEPQRLARVRAFVDSEDLNFHAIIRPGF
jgi:hypothetical protein